VRHPSAKTSFPAGNPIANLLVIIGGALAIGVSIVLGFFAFVALGGIILWFKRKLQQRSAIDDAGHGPKSPNGVIEGEYRVVSKDREEA